jgi:hypothetical protein
MVSPAHPCALAAAHRVASHRDDKNLNYASLYPEQVRRLLANVR